MISRLNLVLLVALVISCLYLVKVSYEARRLFTEVDRAQSHALQLDSDYERLQLERRAQATPLRVEKVARERLAMRSATPAVTEYLPLPARAASAAGAASAAAEGAR